MKHLLFTMVLCILFLMSACNNQENDELENSAPEEEQKSEKIASETDSGDFVLRLVSEKEMYESGEEVLITGKIKYIGGKEEIELTHSESPFYFEMIEVNSGAELSYSLQEIGATTVLKQNEWYEEQYEKGKSTFIEHNNHMDFQNAFIDDDGFPPGEYEIELRTNFHTNIEEESQNHNYITSLVIEVMN
ncbi:hypothetical protein CR194_00240 [Salipaludibacillus keqinensis]|uniref:Intracellular proteinase inhibitor BsuPI domain-containing protein n=1 Tax=Salipaludibacillus keqinensis TaxID=2045207 RepID=A0A323TGQ4_9BACI|nr:hypothetical protein [Salipaludibacillus keqinensis]PYZ94008.1 hypothetical protein CR194_00240 [Salipaludibacillus keqinensis]